MYAVCATIEGGFDDLGVVCAFDPTKVVARLRHEFPGAEVDPTDQAWRDYKGFLRTGLWEEQEAGRPAWEEKGTSKLKVGDKVRLVGRAPQLLGGTIQTMMCVLGETE